MNFVYKYRLELIVFVCGAAVMVLELTGSRLVAPYLGTSIIVWTGIIGVILASLSLGYSWGGKIADNNPDYRKLSQIIFFSAVAVLVLATIQRLTLIIFSNLRIGIYWQTLLSTIILFSPASVLLGMISPYAVRIKMRDVGSIGKTVGNLYAISTIGSIAGTFLAGFVLMAYFDHIKILLFIGIALIVMSFVSEHRNWSRLKVFILALFLLGFFINNLYARYHSLLGYLDLSTAYNRVQIQDGIWKDGRPTRYLSTSAHGFQSAMFLDTTTTELVGEYNKYFDLAQYFHPDFQNALMVGGAAYSFPRHFLDQFPDAAIDVVEIDPGMTKIARAYFGLQDNERLRIFHEDGRMFLNKNKVRYDVICLDAFSTWYALPFHLTTREAAQAMYQSTVDNGVVIMNIVVSLVGEQSEFFRAEYATLKEVFPQVYVFRPSPSYSLEQLQNVILVATKSVTTPSWHSEDDKITRLLSNRYEDVPLYGTILTDNFAPVDSYMTKVAAHKI